MWRMEQEEQESKQAYNDRKIHKMLVGQMTPPTDYIIKKLKGSK